MKMGHCKDCTWWIGEPFNDNNIMFNCCECPKIYYEFDSLIDKPTMDSARYSDYEGYFAMFETAPEFGCIHHATKKSNG